MTVFYSLSDIIDPQGADIPPLIFMETAIFTIQKESDKGSHFFTPDFSTTFYLCLCYNITILIQGGKYETEQNSFPYSQRVRGLQLYLRAYFTGGRAYSRLATAALLGENIYDRSGWQNQSA